MTVIAFVGKPRTGKTLFMTFHGYNNFIHKHKIYANYKLNFKYTSMSPYDMLKIPFTDVDREPKTLMIQEADKWFDSHRSMRNENTLLSSLTGQSGKRNLDIMFDTQFWNRIDSSLRDVTEYIYHSTAFIDDSTKKPLAFQYQIEDMYDGSFRRLPLIPAPILEPFYDMYNSYEATIPLTSGKNMQVISGEFTEEELTAKKHSKTSKKEKRYID